METGKEKRKKGVWFKKNNKKKEGRTFFCARLYIRSLCPIALFPHPNPPILLTPFTQGATCYLCIQDAMLTTRKYLRSDLPIPFSVSHTHTHTHTLQVNGNIPTRSQFTSTLPPDVFKVYIFLGLESNFIAQKTCNVETMKHFKS